MKVFKLWLSPVDNGDGSVSSHLFNNREDADALQRKEAEEGYGWGENCVEEVRLTIKDGVVHVIDTHYDFDEKKLVTNILPLPVTEEEE